MSRVFDAGYHLLSPKQREANALLAGPARHVFLYGGARSGKTFLIVRAIVIRALKARGSRHGIFRFRYNHLRASIWLDTLPKVMKLCFPGVKITDKTQDGYAVLPNGSELWFSGLDDAQRVEKILGLEFSTLMINEASQVPFTSYTTLLTRLAQQTSLKQRCFVDANPPSTSHWLHRAFIERRDPVSKAKLAFPEDYRHFLVNPRDNPNLSAEYIRSLEGLPERQRRRFLEGQFTNDTEGALWPLELLERCRITPDEVPPLERVGIGVDPSGAAGSEDKRSDEIGITAGGRSRDGKAYLLGDYTLRAGPEQWARAVLAAYDKHDADFVVAERNYGGEMVAAIIRSAKGPDGRPRNIPVRLVTASRGKHVRAEPVAALYERDLVRHVGEFRELEDQQMAFTSAGYMGDRSPDRADSWVWLASALMFGQKASPGLAVPIQVGEGARY